MKLRTLFLLLILGAIAAFSALNWGAFSAPTTLSLLESRRHAQELQVNRELADRAEASRFTELRSFLEVELQKLARPGGEPALASEAAILARLDRLEKDVLTAVDESGNSLAASLGELEDRLERRDGVAATPRRAY
jgi:hypothetical protein